MTKSSLLTVTWVHSFYKGRTVTMNSATGNLVNLKLDKFTVLTIPVTK